MVFLKCAAWCIPFLLVACGNLPTPDKVSSDPLPLKEAAPAQWQARLPHNGKLEDMSQWWERQGDPVLVELMEAAQTASPSLAQAKARIGQSRAALAVSRATLGPTLDASASASRALTQANVPAATTLQAGVQAAWEIDLFGASSSASAAAAERLAGAQAAWHDARVSTAAEVANQYVLLRACRTQLVLVQQDADSRAETARLLGISGRAGFSSSGDLELAKAGAADAAGQTVVIQAQCEAMVKGLVALTGIAESDLKQKLAKSQQNQAQEAPIFIANIPADALGQRPDLFAAARDIGAASQDLSSTQAQRYPRLSLSGSIGGLSVNTGGGGTELATWSIGPLALSLPLIDGGRRLANIDAAQARYDEAVAVYRAKVRFAVREVEQALVNLQATSERAASTEASTQAWRAGFAAVQARMRNGFASQIEVEDTRRLALAAETSRLGLQRDRLLAYIALYRAVGGGWQADSLAASAAPGR